MPNRGEPVWGLEPLVGSRLEKGECFVGISEMSSATAARRHRGTLEYGTGRTTDDDRR